MHNLTPVKIESFLDGFINTKLLPIQLTYYPTTYKRTKTRMVQHVIGLIKSAIKALSYIGTIAKMVKNVMPYIKKSLKITKKILLPIIKIIGNIGKKLLFIGFKILRHWISISKNIIIKYLSKIKIFRKIKLFYLRLKRKILHILKTGITIIKNTILKVFRFIVSSINKTIKIIKTSIRLLRTTYKKAFNKFMKSKAGKFISVKLDKYGLKTKNIGAIKRIIKQIGTDAKKVGNYLLNTFKSKSKKVYSNRKEIFNKIKSSAKTITRTILSIGKSILKSFIKIASYMIKPAGKIIKKMFIKVPGLLAKILFNSAASLSAVFPPLFVAIMAARWLGGIALQTGINMATGNITMRDILNAVVENMPYLDIVFSLSGIIEDALDCNFLRNPLVNSMGKFLGFNPQELDNPIKLKKEIIEQNKINYSTIEDANNHVIYLDKISIVNNQIKNDNMNIINIIDEIMFDGTTKLSFLNLLNNHFNKFIDIMKYRNEQIQAISI